VLVRKTDIEADYPLLTKELAGKIGKNQNWTAKALTILGMKGDPKYHQSVRASAKSLIHRYSASAESALRSKLVTDPNFNPYRAG
jgi:hypothetical protein